MRISISPQNDNVNFEPVEINNLQELAEYATKYNYSTGTFKDSYRNKANFLEAECIAIDVDNEDPADNYTIDGAKELFSSYKHVIMPSKSHQKDKHGRVADRFRVILFLESPIQDAKDFTATWGELLKFYPAADRACKDASRFYYPSPNVYSINEDGKQWPISIYEAPQIDPIDLALSDETKGQLSRETMHFFSYGAPVGKRNVRLFKAAKDMQEQGFSIEECKARVAAMVELTGNWAQNYLSEKDLDTIDNAYKQASLYNKREGEATRQTAFNFQTIKQMLEEAGDVEWLCDNLLSKGGFSLIVGPPKAGKSTLVRQLVKNVCQGGEFLERNVNTGSVMYLTFEEQPSILKEQFNRVGIKQDDPILIHTGAVFDERALDDLEEAIYEFQPELVILDTLFDISNLEEINSYKAVKDALSKVRSIARNTDTHILGVHHSNKLGEFLGSQAIFGAVDTMIKFVPQKERRFLFSSGKHGEHWDDREIIFNLSTQSYSLGNNRDKKESKL